MANRAYQNLAFFGNPEDVKEIEKYLNDKKNHKDFPISVLAEEEEKIVITTNYAPLDLTDLSKKFPNVGIYSTCFNENGPEESWEWIINGDIVATASINHDPERRWREVTKKVIDMELGNSDLTKESQYWSG